METHHPLFEQLDHPDSSVREHAFKEIAKLEPDLAVVGYLKGIGDAEPTIRCLCIDATGDLRKRCRSSR